MCNMYSVLKRQKPKTSQSKPNKLQKKKTIKGLSLSFRINTSSISQLYKKNHELNIKFRLNLD